MQQQKRIVECIIKKEGVWGCSNWKRTGKLTLLLSANREPGITTLLEDCHYQPKDLVKLLYLQNVMCLEKRGMRHSGEGNNETLASWDDNCGQFDDGNAYDGLNESIELKYAQRIPKQYQYTVESEVVTKMKSLLPNLQVATQHGNYLDKCFNGMKRYMQLGQFQWLWYSVYARNLISLIQNGFAYLDVYGGFIWDCYYGGLALYDDVANQT
ncbi:hypothetical protein Tco_0231753 [Tanacetum coccineum]